MYLNTEAEFLFDEHGHTERQSAAASAVAAAASGWNLQAPLQRVGRDVARFSFA